MNSQMFKVSALQFDIAWESPEQNFLQVEPFIKKAAKARCDLFVLPEMFATGFTMNLNLVLSAELKVRKFLAKQSKENRVPILAGLAAQGTLSSKGSNLACFYSQKGDFLGEYQKIHPFSLGKEGEYFEKGQDLKVFGVEPFRFAPVVCYDLRFPEIFRALASKVCFIVVIANWPSSRMLAWSTLLRARAIENQCYILGVNRVGTGGGLTYSGFTQAFDPLGESLGTLAEGTSGLLNFEIQPRLVQECRERFPFLKDRQNKLYSEMYTQLYSEGEAD